MLLTKLGDDYKLYSHDSCIATTHESPYKKLSIKNCEAIANGYDLNELAREACDITDPLRLDSQKYKQDPYFKIGFIKGFQKALEILGDKKFSETELYRAFLINSAGNNTTLENTFKETVLPLIIDNEWYVEIEMVSIPADRAPNGWDISPKLDEDGCLILKRK